MAFLVTDLDIGNGLEISAAAGVAGTKVQAKLGAGLVFNGALIELDTLPVVLSNPSGPNLQTTVNGSPSNILDLTPAIQAGETTTTLTYNSTSKTLTYTNEDGVAADVDLSALAVDVYVDGATYNASTMVLTLTDTNGTTPDVTVSLADLKAIVTANTNSITLSGTGESATPLKADVKLDPLAGNLLKVTAAGTKVDPADVVALATYDAQSLQGVHLFYAFP